MSLTMLEDVHLSTGVTVGGGQHDQGASMPDRSLMEAPSPPPATELSKTRSALLITTMSTVMFLNTLSSGLLTVCLPIIARSVSLAPNLLLWPASVYALSLSCTLLPLGAIADVVGPRPIFVAGTALLTLTTLAVALARTGIELVVFRALQGLAMAFCMPTAVSIITANFPTGSKRNVAFALFGGGSPIGFALGLVLGGILADSVSWRVGYYLSAGVNGLIFLVALFAIPATGPQPQAGGSAWERLGRRIDWVGVAIASVCLALSSYIFAKITLTPSTLKEPTNITLLTIAVLLVPAFPLWMARQTRLNRPAMIPNSLWRRAEFTAICLSVFLTWAWFNAYGYWTTLLFQDHQHISALSTSLRFLPLVVAGVLTNVAAGLLVDKVSANVLVLVASLLSALSPALLATPSLDTGNYFPAIFIAMVLSPISSDILFNVSNLVITNIFSAETQALAGGVFNTLSQLGNSVGLAMTSIVASAIAARRYEVGDGEEAKSTHAEATLEGYRAAFWCCFAAALCSCAISVWGLRRSGKVGLKRD